MLPEASEQVADPHNFLFEIWATAGTPAVVFLVAALALFAWRVFWPENRVTGNEPQATETESKARRGDVSAQRASRLIYLGGLCGAVAAYPLGLLVHLIPDPNLLIFGVPLAAITVFLLHPWVVDGHLDARAVAIAAVVLLVNLLAAGGIAFPGVAGSLWLLVGIALVVASEQERELSPARPAARDAHSARGGRDAQPAGVERDAQPTGVGQTRVALVMVLDLLAFCYWTGYAPVLHGRALLERGEDLVYTLGAAESRVQAQERISDALGSFEEAAAADPFAAEPRLNAAHLYHLERLQAADEASFEAATKKFDVACGEAVRLNPRSHTTATEIGYMEFEAYDATGDREHLRRAREQLERAVQLFPNHGFAHARLAWVYHLEGNATAAAREADEALRLDALTPHKERKLRQRGIFDDLAAPEQLERLQERLPPGRTAEQLMSDVRNVPGETAP
jgi:tetratricopeptide (TPR) repeat protein